MHFGNLKKTLALLIVFIDFNFFIPDLVSVQLSEIDKVNKAKAEKPNFIINQKAKKQVKD